MIPCPLAIFGTINGFELLVVVAAALMVFGSRLPDVALRAVAHVMRARRAVSKMWRDTGLEEELRRVRRDIEMNVPRAAEFDVASAPPPPAATLDHHDDAEDPDAARAEEYYDSSVDIRPAEGIIASGEWSSEEDVDRREPTGSEEPEPSAGEESPGSAGEARPEEVASEPDAGEEESEPRRREG